MAGEGFATTAGNIGSGIGDFIGNLTTPLFGGTTTQTSTTAPTKVQGSNLPLVIGIVALVAVLGIVGYFIFRR